MKPSWIRYSVIFDDIFLKKMSCNQSNHFFGTFFKISNGTRQKDRKLQTRPTGFEQRPRKHCACGHWRLSSKTNWFCAKAIHTQQKQGEPENPKDKPDTRKPIFNVRLMLRVHFVIWVTISPWEPKRTSNGNLPPSLSRIRLSCIQLIRLLFFSFQTDTTH